MTASQASASVVPWSGLMANASGVSVTISQPSANACSISSRRTRRGPQTPGRCPRSDGCPGKPSPTPLTALSSSSPHPAGPACPAKDIIRSGPEGPGAGQQVKTAEHLAIPHAAAPVIERRRRRRAIRRAGPARYGGDSRAEPGEAEYRDSVMESAHAAVRGGWLQPVLRVTGAGLLAATASIHLDLYLTGFKHIPTIGPLFLLQIIAGFALAVAVLATGNPVAAALGA